MASVGPRRNGPVCGPKIVFHLIFDLQNRDSDSGAHRSLGVLPVSEKFRGWNFLSEDFAPPFPTPQVSVGKIFREAGSDTEKHLDARRVRGDLFHSLYSRMITLPAIELGRQPSRATFAPSLRGLLGRRDSIIQEILDGSTVLRRARSSGTVEASWVSN